MVETSIREGSLNTFFDPIPPEMLFTSESEP
jgi:hypothetical protein